MMTESEICEADNKLQRDYNKGKISLEDWNFAKKVLHEEWIKATKEKEILEKIIKKHA